MRWRPIQIVLDAGYSDAFRTRHPSHPGFTFPTWDPHVSLDYLFVPGVFVDDVTRCEVVRMEGTRAASDHHPVVSEIQVPAAGSPVR